MSDATTERDPLARSGGPSAVGRLLSRTADPAVGAAREAARRRLREVISAGVPDATGVDALLERDGEAVRSAATRFLAGSSDDRDAADAVLAGSTAALRDRLAGVRTDGTPAGDGTVRRYLVDTADGIFTTGGGPLTLLEIHTGPNPENNFARFVLDDEHHGSGFTQGDHGVTFDFTWRNESAAAVSVDVHGYLVLDGTAVTLCDGGWFALNSSTMDVIPTMALFDPSTTPPSQLPTQDGDSTVALHLSCESAGVIEPGDIDGQDIARGYDLQHTGALVAAGGQLRVQLSVVFSLEIVGDGQVQAAFATGPRRVLTPGVLFVATDL